MLTNNTTSCCSSSDHSSCDHHHHGHQQDLVSEEYAHICHKLQTILFNEETRKEIESLVQDNLIPNIVSLNIQPSVWMIKSLLQNPSLPLILYDLCFEVFNPSVSLTLFMRQQKLDEELQVVIEFVEAIYNHSSPKEVQSLLSEALTANTVNIRRVNDFHQIDILNFGPADFNNQAILDHNLFLLKLLFENLSRLPETEKRWFFFKVLDYTFSNVCSTRVETIQNEAYGDEEMMKSEADKKMALDRNFLGYSTCLVDCLLSACSSIFEKKSSDSISQKIHLKRESDCFLQICFTILAKIYSNENLVQICTENGTLLKVMQSITACKRTFNDIVEYSKRFKAWSDVNNSKDDQIDEEDEDEEMSEDDEEEDIKNFVFWDNRGLGIFIYLLLDKAIERKHYSLFILSDLYIFIMCKYYTEIMLQSGMAGFATAALSILRKLFENNIKKKGSLVIKLGVPEYDLASYFDLAQSLISFMTVCPNNNLRTMAYKVFQDFITRFNDEDRFNILYHIMNKCPYPYLVAIILDRLKEEIILEYNAVFQRIDKKKIETLRELNEYNPIEPPKLEEVNEFLKNNKANSETQNYFSKFAPNTAPKINYDSETVRDIRLFAKDSKAFLVPHKIPNLIIELLEKYVEDPFDSDNIQVILRALNLYYFLLLRDSEPNVTGVLDSEIVSKMEEKVLNKLNSACEKLTKVIQEHNAMQLGDEEEEDLDYDELMDEFESEFTPEEIQALQELKSQEKEKSKIKEQSSHELDLHLLNEVLTRIHDILSGKCK
ncbi:predicted protein [Naegleria gruberi]|uniref:Predicted protein n=1 Tax=Naegleria gruberi TaxID=5762 RepID=D2V9V0_NAEGR|nr:uncharacterized protein NAEGRDRAFT_65636 [Naegleria gruberi]EFC46204.1 predicted protein [Naegleria gruberi]|eukprot:XP_002678948.1 predicted protein [Naegleria gruberi strain NEG-M]